MNEVDEKKTQAWKDWCLLYEYVKREIMQYSDDMKLPRFMVLRLRGLSQGRFMANKSQKPQANYGFDVILMTFKAQRQNIVRYVNKTEFKDEQHKFNYIMIIIENNINDIVLRLNRVKEHNKRAESLDTQHINIHQTAAYKGKTKKKTSEKLDDIW